MEHCPDVYYISAHNAVWCHVSAVLCRDRGLFAIVEAKPVLSWNMTRMRHWAQVHYSRSIHENVGTTKVAIWAQLERIEKCRIESFEAQRSRKSRAWVQIDHAAYLQPNVTSPCNASTKLFSAVFKSSREEIRYENQPEAVGSSVLGPMALGAPKIGTQSQYICVGRSMWLWKHGCIKLS